MKTATLLLTILTGVQVFAPAQGQSVREGHIDGRVVSGGGAPEAGVWVIAETDELATDFRKIVVTDDAGRFVLPQLPPVVYALWVRGYGLADSQPVGATPGESVELKVEQAADAAEAALIYPSNYWLSLLEPPSDEDFSSDSEGGRGGVFPGSFRSRAAWSSQLKLNCVLCHQLGSAATRLPGAPQFDHGLKKASGMEYFASALGRNALTAVLGDWGGRIAAGDVPVAPPRPAGRERDFVITQWGWGDEFTYAHDQIATDKRDPTRYANGPIYGVDIGNDHLLMIDPERHTAERIRVPTRDGFDVAWCEQTYKAAASDKVGIGGFGSLGCPAPGGATPYKDRYHNPANPHNPMMDATGKVWMTTQIRRQWDEDLPAFCRNAPELVNRIHHRQLGYYDTKTEEFVLVDTCYGTHHLQFDADGVLWTSGDAHVIGWFDPGKFDPAVPETLEAAQGWSEVRIDTDGDGKADTPQVGFHYGVIPNPVDGSVWTAIPPGIVDPAGGRGLIHRYDPASGTHEVYAPPASGYGPRGIDVDTNGVIWTALAGSGHVARFDRARCRQTWGRGAQCPEGWTLWASPGPQFKGVAERDNGGSTDMHYYLWVDQFDTLGMGADTVMVNGTGSDSLLAFDPRSETFTVIRIPYPLNTYTRGLDGRIDDAGTGWKGRGLWFTNGLDPVLHSEIPKSYLGRVQLRPHPLAH